MKNKGLIIGILIGIIITVCVGIGVYFLIMPKDIITTLDKDKIEEYAKEIKKDPSKDLVYQADYTLEGYEEVWYYSEDVGKECSLADIKIPYININSEDAYKLNAELKELYYETAGYFKEEADKTYDPESENYGEILLAYYSDYKYYINNNILSIFVKQGMNGLDAVPEEYITCNFDLKTGKKLEFEDIYKSADFSKEEVDEKAKKVIANYETYEMMRENEIEEESFIEELISKSVKRYEDNNFQYFLSNNGVLNIIVEMEIPAGAGVYATTLQVHKEDNKNNYEIYKIKEDKGNSFATYLEDEEEDMYEAFYTLDDEEETEWRFAERVYAPYININSEDAKKANKEIKTEYEKIVQKYKDEFSSDELYSQNAYYLNYNWVEYDNYLSVVVESGCRDVNYLEETNNYFVYNFDLSTGNLLTYKELYEAFGYTENDIDKKIKAELEKHPYIACYEEDEYKKVLDKAIKNYKELLEKDNLKMSMNFEDGISAYFKLETPGFYEKSELEIKIK